MRLTVNILMILLMWSCTKINMKDGHKRLPRATTKGRGIFACYIDNETYIARRQEAVTYNPETGYLFLENSNKSFEFRLFVHTGIYGGGNYQFENTGEEWVNKSYTEVFGLKADGLNQLQITALDTDKRIVSGNFNIDLIATEGTEKQIRDGRFDLEIQLIQ